MIKNVRTVLTEKQLELLSDEMKYEKLKYYLTHLNEDSHEGLSFEEKLWIFKNITDNYLYFQVYPNSSNNTWNEYLPYLENRYLEDSKFYFLFFHCYYCYNLETGKEHEYLFMLPFSQTRVTLMPFTFPELSNQENVKFLNTTYEKWNEIIEVETHQNQLLAAVVKECKYMREKEKKAYKKQQLESSSWRTIERQLVLFYKYAYLKGQITFKFKTEFLLPLLGKVIVFDFESYFHIQRHFAQSLKPDLLNKSYFKQDFLPDNIVGMLSDIFNKVSESNSKIIFLEDGFGIFSELNQIVYQLWIKKSTDTNIFRIVSLYPFERNDYTKSTQVRINENLSYFE